jgi:hypothetical protein
MYSSIVRKQRTFFSRGVSDFKQRVAWCQETFGPGQEVHSVVQAGLHRWSWENVGLGLEMLHFKEHDDYMFYLLRWGQ